MINTQLRNEARGKGMNAWKYLGIYSNVSAGDRVSSKRKAHVYSNEAVSNLDPEVHTYEKDGKVHSYTLYGGKFLDSKKYTITEKDRKEWDQHNRVEKNAVYLSPEETSKFKSELESMIENASSPEDIVMIGDKIAEAKDHNYDIDLFDYTHKALQKKNEIMGDEE